MGFRIRLPDGESFGCDAGQSILEAGLRARFSFPHACRNGNCERCMGRLLRGRVRLARKDLTIHAGEAGSDQVLYCLAQPLSDCEIDVPQVAPATQLPTIEVAAQITHHEPLSHDVTRVMLTLPAGRKVQWYAGQYLELMMPSGPCAFSIANAPGGRELELHVRHTADNPASLEVMDILRRESVVTAKLPGGQRFVDPLALPDQPIWFICGSTGFAPAKAMIETLLDAGFQHDIRLYWGARSRQDLYLHELARSWAKRRRLTYVPVLSDQPEAAMREGMVHEAVLQDLAQPTEPLFYVGGSPPMAWAVFDALVAADVPAGQIHSDVFDYAPREA